MLNKIVVCSFMLVLLSALCTVSCSRLANGKKIGHHSIEAIMDSTESILDDDPTLALTLLDSIDASCIWSRKDNARYALLYTEAQYKNYLPIADDSLIMISVRYYSDHKHPDYLFRSYYILGCIYAQLGYLSNASVALSQAEMLVNYVDEDFRRGLLYSKMGEVFFNSYDFKRAEPLFWKAVDYFESAGKDLYRYCALNDIGSIMIEFNKQEEAVNYFDQAIEWARSADERDYLYYYLMNKMTSLVMADDSKGASPEIEEFLFTFGVPDDDSRSLGMIARYYILTHDQDSARYYLDKAWNTSHDVDSINLYYAESLYQKMLCNPDSALTLYNKSIDIQNDKLLTVLDQPIVSAQRDYFRAVMELESVKSHNRVIILIASIIISCLITISIILFGRYQRRKEEARIRDYLFTIDELTARDSWSQETIQDLNAMLREKSDSEKTDKETIEKLNQRVFELSAWESINKGKISNLNLKVREMLRQQFVHSDYLYTRYYEQLDDSKKAERLYKVVKSQIDGFTVSRNIVKLDDLLNEAFGGIMDKLSSPEVELQDKELQLIRFVLAGFSAKSIAALLNDSHQNINQRKKRLLDKIDKKAPGLMKELCIALNIK